MQFYATNHIRNIVCRSASKIYIDKARKTIAKQNMIREEPLKKQKMAFMRTLKGIKSTCKHLDCLERSRSFSLYL